MMNTQATPLSLKPKWQIELANGIKNVTQLLRVLELPDHGVNTNSHNPFPLKVPHSYVKKIRKSDPNDPLLLQILPTQLELNPTPGFTNDPVGDKQYEQVPGLIHKYHGRVLLVTTSVCSLHCRYCFRRHFPYSQSNPSKADWQQALAYIANTPSIHEVILSGGDPLSLSDSKLAELTQKLNAIPHLKYLRIHTRFPVILPERIDLQLLHWIKNTRLKVSMVIHANHPNEINDEVRYATLKLKQAAVELFNQTVLLKKINDDAQTLITLSHRLYECGILPYYIHSLDKVAGAAHFEVDLTRSKKILKQVRAALPGYLVPQLVKEEIGVGYKTPIF